MKRNQLSRRCRCKRYKATWLCTFPNCSEFLFCKKCRKNHNRRHEENFYPVRELLEEDNDESHDEFEFTSNEWEQFYHKIDDEIEHMQDEFDENMKSVRKCHRKQITEFKIMNQSKSPQSSLSEFRQKVLHNPNDDALLLRLGREYHKYLQESNVQGADRRKIIQKLKDDINQRFANFREDLMVLFEQLKSKEPQSRAKLGEARERQNESKDEELVESEVRNSTIPKEWDKEDPMEEVNKSLHMIRENKRLRGDTREE